MATAKSNKPKSTKQTKTAKTQSSVKKTVRAKPSVQAAPKAKPTVKKVATAESKTQGVSLKSRGVEIPVVDTKGTATSSMKLPEFLTVKHINKALLAQAVRVYLANQREGSASTKTRGKVEGSTRKIYRQKGTGRARHGSIRAPIFVGGGITFGPQPRDFSMRLNKKMKQAAFCNAITAAVRDGKVLIVDGVGSMEPKTKKMAAFLDSVGRTKRMLIVTGQGQDGFMRASRNIRNVSVRYGGIVGAYDVLSHDRVIFSKEAFGQLRAQGGEEKA